MFDILSTLVTVVIAMWAGWHFRGIVILAKFSTDPDHFINILKQIKELNEKERKEVVDEKVGTELAIERHGNTLYAFAKDNDQFIAQGPSLDALLEDAKKRFPNRKFFGVIAKDDPAKELA